MANDCCAWSPRDCHTYNDVCFKGQITSLWWKCISPCVIIIGTHCSHLHCAWLQFSHFSASETEGMVMGGFYYDLHNLLISSLPPSPLKHQIMHVSLYSASTQYVKSTSEVVYKHGYNTSLILCSTFLGQKWFVYLNCMPTVSVFPQGLKQSSPTYWLADAFWGPEQLLRIQPFLMEIRGEACIIYTHALNDLLPIILVWNQFVSLNAFVYLLSCWDAVKN